MANQHIEQFIHRLEKMNSTNLNRLGRDAGTPLTEARTINIFLRIFPKEAPYRDQDAYFLVAGLYGICQQSGSGSLGLAFSRLKNATGRDSIDRRLDALLAADESMLPQLLPPALRLLHSNNIKPPAWEKLLYDLIYWNHPDQFVSRQWATDYYQSAYVQTSAQDRLDWLVKLVREEKDAATGACQEHLQEAIKAIYAAKTAVGNI